MGFFENGRRVDPCHPSLESREVSTSYERDNAVFYMRLEFSSSMGLPPRTDREMYLLWLRLATEQQIQEGVLASSISMRLHRVLHGFGLKDAREDVRLVYAWAHRLVSTTLMQYASREYGKGRKRVKSCWESNSRLFHFCGLAYTTDSLDNILMDPECEFHTSVDSYILDVINFGEGVIPPHTFPDYLVE